jgi:phosphoglycolate phosphatase-like HAD superfamily hydrolase
MLYVFDFDGVIANTHEMYVDFVAKAMFVSTEKARQIIHEHTLKNERSGLVSSIIKGFYLKSLERFIHSKQDILFRNHLETIRLLPGKKVILSRNYKRFMNDMLGEDASMFDGMYGYDEANTKMSGMDSIFQDFGVAKDDCIFITDTVGDILEVQQRLELSHIYAVDWGYNTVEELEQVIAKTQIISSLTQLPT